MWIVSPVTKAAASEARKAITEATSSGVPNRRMGVAAIRAAPLLAMIASVIGVAMMPGETQLARMLRGASSCTIDRVKPSTAALQAA